MNITNEVTIGPTDSQCSRSPAWLARRWPTAAGVILAALVAFGSGTADHTDVAPVVTASGFVYLTAARYGDVWRHGRCSSSASS